MIRTTLGRTPSRNWIHSRMSKAWTAMSLLLSSTCQSTSPIWRGIALCSTLVDNLSCLNSQSSLVRISSNWSRPWSLPWSLPRSVPLDISIGSKEYVSVGVRSTSPRVLSWRATPSCATDDCLVRGIAGDSEVTSDRLRGEVLFGRTYGAASVVKIDSVFVSVFAGGYLMPKPPILAK